MTACVCVCVLLLVLGTTCLGLPLSPQDQRAQAPPPASALVDSPPPGLSGPRGRHRRAAPPQMNAALLAQEEVYSPRPGANLSQMLARLLSSAKGEVRRDSAGRRPGLSAGHRITDRDYLGWMDFGRRSAEEYEYSS